MTEEALPPVEEEVPVTVEEPTVPPESVEEPAPVIPPKSEFLDAVRIEYEVWIPTDIYQADRRGFETIAELRFEEHHRIPAAGITSISRQVTQEGTHQSVTYTVLTVYSFVHQFTLKEAGNDAL